MAQVESTTWLDFVRDRDELMQTKHRETARHLAEELVQLMELLAIHGSTGIDGDACKRELYVRQLHERIRTAAYYTEWQAAHG